MNKNLKIFIVIVVIILIAWFAYSHKKTNQEVLVPTQESIKGCYVAHLAKDVYTLKINSQEFENFDGTLSYKNFEKDSSHGTYIGTYRNGILLGEYSFSSEGMDSTSQVIFKKVGDNFVQGFGEYEDTGDHFKDLNNITYDPKSTFIPSADCPL